MNMLELLSLVPLVLTGPVAVSVCVLLLQRGHRRAVWGFWALLLCATVIQGISIAHTFADFFPGAGCLATILIPVSVMLTTLVFLRLTRGHRQTHGQPAGRRPPYALLLALIVLQLSAPVIAFGYAQSCALLNRRAARPILDALESYRREHGRYPFPTNRHRSDLGLLIPEHLAIAPPLACQRPFGLRAAVRTDAEWRLYFCQNSPEQETLLLVPLVGTDSQQIYNPETKWWRRGNALDGYCP